MAFSLAENRHLEQSSPWEWRAFGLGNDTIVVHSTDENTPDAYRVDQLSRNVRVIATADAVLYDGKLLEPFYEERYRSVALQHFYAGKVESFFSEEWLDEPAPVLERLNNLGAVPLEETDG